MAGLDSLAVLQQELQRIGKNQLTLRGAIENDKAIVLHPSQQARLYIASHISYACASAPVCTPLKSACKHVHHDIACDCRHLK